MTPLGRSGPLVVALLLGATVALAFADASWAVFALVAAPTFVVLAGVRYWNVARRRPWWREPA